MSWIVLTHACEDSDSASYGSAELSTLSVVDVTPQPGWDCQVDNDNPQGMSTNPHLLKMFQPKCYPRRSICSTFLNSKTRSTCIAVQQETRIHTCQTFVCWMQIPDVHKRTLHRYAKKHSCSFVRKDTKWSELLLQSWEARETPNNICKNASREARKTRKISRLTSSREIQANKHLLMLLLHTSYYLALSRRSSSSSRRRRRPY